MLVPLALFGWPIVVVGLFVALPPRRAVLASVFGGWLFLPMAEYDLPGLPPYDKMAATVIPPLLCAFLFDSGRLSRLRPGPWDMPVAIWCLCPFVTSLTNGLGVYDGLSELLEQTVTWGFPYLLGRFYFSDREGLRELAVSLFIAGLVYLPFCVWELRMSPRLHLNVYGFRQHTLSQAVRGESWRPMVFMQHGLAVASFMASACLAGITLWRNGALRRLMGYPIAWFLLPLLAVTILLKSLFAVLLLAAGAVIVLIRPTGTMRLLLVGLAVSPLAYMAVRSAYPETSVPILSAVRTVASQQRADSLETRLISENYLVVKALQSPVFGWGGHSRSLATEKNRIMRTDEGKRKIIHDGLWLIALGTNGLVGLAGLMGLLLYPVLYLVRRIPTPQWTLAAAAPVLALTIMLVLHACDNLLNAMISPLFPAAAGAVLGFLGPGRPPDPRPSTLRVRTAGGVPDSIPRS